MELQAIYKDGETHFQTTVLEDQCAYTKNPETGKPYNAAEYLDTLGPGYALMPLEDALERIHQAEEAQYIKPWAEISEDRWDEMLNVLPPIRWQTVRGINFFQISEMMTGNITSTFAKVDGKCFEAMRRTSDKYEELAIEIAQVL